MNIIGGAAVQLGLDNGGFMAGIAASSNALRGFSSNASFLSKAATAFTAVSMGAVTVGVATLKMAGDFDSATTTLVTGAGESVKNLGMIRDGILSLGPVTGETTQQLTAGMFEIESSGQRGTKALLTLKDAAEGAKVGGADLGAVANGVTTEMTDYASSNLTAAQATNDLIATVANGKTHMQDLANSMSSILPTAAAMHVGLTDVSGAMATMTGEGVPAANAATYLRQTLLGLEAPGSKTVKTLAEIGLSSKTVADTMQKSLPAALQLITDALAKKFPVGSAAYVAALKDIAGGARNMQGILDLTGSHLQVFQENVTNIADAVKKGGDAINGWSLVQQDFNQKMDQAKASLEKLGIELGEKLLPLASQGIDLFAKLTGAIGTDLTGAFTGINSPANDLARNLEMFASDTEQAIQNSGAFQSVLQTIKDILPSVGQFVGNVADSLETNLLPPTLSLIKNFSDWVDKSGAVQSALQTLGGGIETVSGLLGPLIQDLSNVFDWLSKNKPASDALVTAVVILGGAFVALKLADTVASFGQMFAKITDGKGVVEGLASSIVNKFAPNLVKALDGTATKAKDACDNVGCIGENAKASAAEVSTASAIEEGDLSAVDAKVKGMNADLIATGPAAAEGGAAAKVGMAGFLESLTTAAGFATLLAIPFFTASPSTKAVLVPDKKDQYPAPPGFWDFITHQGVSNNQISDFQGILAQPAADSKVVAENMDKAYADMQDLYAAAFKRGELLGDLSDPRTMDAADVKVQELKSHLDDLKGPFPVHVLTPDVIAARLPVIDLKSHVDDLHGPVSIGVLTPDVIKARLPVIDLKSHIDDLKGPVSIGVLTPDVIKARLPVIELKSHIDDLKGPVNVGITYGSVDAATAKVMYLKSQLDDMPSPSISIPAASGAAFHGHATGILNSPTGHFAMVGEQGPELMYVPKGASIYPHNQLSSSAFSGGASTGGTREIHIHLDVSGQEFSEAIVNDMGDALVREMRLRTGMKV